MNGTPRRVMPLALVVTAHAALAWGLWHAVIHRPDAGVLAPGARWVVPARLVPDMAPPVSRAAPQPTLQRRRAAAPDMARATAAELDMPQAPAAIEEPAAASPQAVVDGVPLPQEAPAPLVVAAAALTVPAPPAARTRVPPDNSPCGRAPYPLLLQERGIEGTLRLRVHVAADGRATQVQLLASSGFRLFDEAALAQARGCRFRPARWGDDAVDEWVEYPVRFSLQG